MPETSLDQADVIKETELFISMCTNLPIGFNRHFNMMASTLIYNARNSSDIDSGEIWKFFNQRYRPNRLDDLYRIPFPNDDVDFDLYEFDEFKEMIDRRRKEEQPSSSSSAAAAASTTVKSEFSTKESIEASDDNTLSGASTPVNATATPTTSTSSRKRKSNAITASNEMDKTPTLSSSRRRDRIDSEKNDQKHSNHRNRTLNDNKDDKMDKTVPHSSTAPNSSKDNSSSSKRVRTMPKRPSRNSSGGGGQSSSSSNAGSSTPKSSSNSSSSSTSLLSSATNKKNDKKIK